MRIISGSAKGKRLVTFPDRGIRPTPDRVREAIFSILYSRLGALEGRKVLDLFAGTGAMGIEALSRGASRGWLVDQGAQAAGVISSNLKICCLEERATFIRSGVLQTLSRLEREKPFDLIFLDPPYGKGLVQKVVAALADSEFLAPEGIICAESASQDDIPGAIGGLVRIDKRCYGSTAVHFFAYPEQKS